MNRPRAILTLSCLCASLALAGCQAVRPDFDARAPAESADESLEFQSFERDQALPASALEPSQEPYLVGVGDVLEIEISEVPGTRAETFVMPDGMLYYDLAGGVRAGGVTLETLRSRLQTALESDYSSPLVQVTLREVNSRRYWILGRVNSPGLYPIQQPTTLLEAIARAGGLFTSRFSGSTEELGDLGRSVIIRDGKVLPVDFKALLREGDMSQNIYVHPDDYILIPSALSSNVYVLGEVRQPQAIGFKDNLTLVAAIAAAKGPLPKARVDQVLLVRGSLLEPQVAVVDFGAVLTGKEKNFELEPFDIIWVPKDPWLYLEDTVWSIVNTAARTIAVREGARAANLEGEGAETFIPVTTD
jgi:protein involved in polysaccharide export with SLBB domain